MPPRQSLATVDRAVLRRLRGHLRELLRPSAVAAQVCEISGRAAAASSACSDGLQSVSTDEHAPDAEAGVPRVISGYRTTPAAGQAKRRGYNSKDRSFARRYVVDRVAAPEVLNRSPNLASRGCGLYSLGFRAAAAAFCDSSGSRFPGDADTDSADDDELASTDDWIGEEVAPAEATAETVVAESSPDLIDDSEVHGADVPVEGATPETRRNADFANPDVPQEVPVEPRAGVPELDTVDDVEMCSDEDIPEAQHATPTAPPVLVTYATGARWESLQKAETFSYTAELAKAAAEQAEDPADLAMSEPRSDPEGRSYLHIMTVEEILHIMEKVRAKDVEVIPVRDLCEWTDHLVFATGRSDKHLRGIADAIVYQVKRRSKNVDSNSYPIVEGRDSSLWVVVDCGSVVVHVFEEDARKYYNLESLWKVKRLEGGEQRNS